MTDEDDSPTDAAIRARYVGGYVTEDVAVELAAEFDTWLAQHDREVRRKLHLELMNDVTHSWFVMNIASDEAGAKRVLEWIARSSVGAIK